VIDAKQAGQLDLGVDLFATLPHRGRRRIFIVVDKSPGQAPLAVRGLDGAPAEHDSAFGFHDHRRGDLGIAPQHVAVVRADLNLPTLDRLERQRGAAVDAEMTHRIRA
jgi:hypothetical protein